MKASELIKKLQEVIELDGDREVFYYGENPAIDSPTFKRKVTYIGRTIGTTIEFGRKILEDQFLIC